MGRDTAGMSSDRPDLTFYPVTPERWADLVELFGENGACEGCWCMYWRVAAAEYEAGKGEPNQEFLRERVESGDPPGLLAYEGETPVGWCAVGPRAEFVRLENSRILAPVDDAPVWSVPCFYVAPQARGRGVSVALLDAATEHVRQRGGELVEGYPVEPTERQSPAFVWTGLAGAFAAAGFDEVERRSEKRPIMRRTVGGS